MLSPGNNLGCVVYILQVRQYEAAVKELSAQLKETKTERSSKEVAKRDRKFQAVERLTTVSVYLTKLEF